MVFGTILGLTLLVNADSVSLHFCADRVRAIRPLALTYADSSVLAHFRQGLYRLPRSNERSPLRLLTDLQKYLKERIVGPVELLKFRDSLVIAKWDMGRDVEAKRQEILASIPPLLTRDFDSMVADAAYGRISIDHVVRELEIAMTNPDLALASAEAIAFLVENGSEQVRASVSRVIPHMEWDLHRQITALGDSPSPALTGALAILKASESLVLVEIQRSVTNRVLDLLRNPKLPERIRKRFVAILNNETLALPDSLETEAFLLTRADKPPIPLPEDMAFPGVPTRERLMSWMKIKDPILYFSFVGQDPQKSNAARKIAALLYVEADYYYHFPEIAGERRRDVTLIFARYADMLELLRRTAHPLEWEIERRQSP